MFSYLIQGIIIGFAVAMPVGPIGILCFRQSITSGMLAGLACGLGAAFADTLFGLVGGLSIEVIAAIIGSYKQALQLLGGLFLIYLGWYCYHSKPDKLSSPPPLQAITMNFISTFLLTLMNPLTIMSYAAIYAGIGVGNDAGQISDTLIVTMGIFTGSMLWWCILCGIGSLGKGRFSSKAVILINHASGIVIICFGILALVFTAFELR